MSVTFENWGLVAGFLIVMSFPTESMKVAIADEVYFNYSSSEVAPDQKERLARLLQFKVRQHLDQSGCWFLTGHADSTETGLVDLRTLGDQRVQAVASSLKAMEPGSHLVLQPSDGEVGAPKPSPDPKNAREALINSSFGQNTLVSR